MESENESIFSAILRASIWKTKMKLKLEKYFIETKKVPSFTFFQHINSVEQPTSQNHRHLTGKISRSVL